MREVQFCTNCGKPLKSKFCTSCGKGFASNKGSAGGGGREGVEVHRSTCPGCDSKLALEGRLEGSEECPKCHRILDLAAIAIANQNSVAPPDTPKAPPKCFKCGSLIIGGYCRKCSEEFQSKFPQGTQRVAPTSNPGFASTPNTSISPSITSTMPGLQSPTAETTQKWNWQKIGSWIITTLIALAIFAYWQKASHPPEPVGDLGPTLDYVGRQIFDSSSTTYRGQQGYLGINYQPTTSGGALVKGVLWASPAERAGIMEGDCLIAIDGSRINAFSPDQSLVAGKAVGQAVTVTFERGGQSYQAQVVLGPP